MTLTLISPLLNNADKYAMFDVQRASLVQCLRVGLQANRLSDRQGHDSLKIHLIRQGCSRPSIALQFRIVAKQHSFIHV